MNRDVLFITRPGAGRPMRVRVVRLRRDRWTRSAARNLHCRGEPLWSIAWRLKVSRAVVLRFLADAPTRETWRSVVRAATRELELAA